MQISWSDLNRPASAGQYPWRGAMVQVDSKHIKLWQEHPDAKFTLVPVNSMAGPKRFLLGTAQYDD